MLRTANIPVTVFNLAAIVKTSGLNKSYIRRSIRQKFSTFYEPGGFLPAI